jgi:NAD(P)-dependent dehydrogenase (short-subunit alcohol dehydrogenase family)
MTITDKTVLVTGANRGIGQALVAEVHAVLTGPTDTDMVRDLDIPKASPESVARAILDGVEHRGGGDLPRPHVSVHGCGLAQRRGQGARAPERRARTSTARHCISKGRGGG